MKLAVFNIDKVSDIATLKALTPLINGVTMYVESESNDYTYYINASEGDHTPDDSEITGFWKLNTRSLNNLFVVFDSYDFIVSNATDISTIENWYKFGFELLGSSIGFKDVMCLRSVIKILIESKCGVDYATFEASLSDAEKEIAYKFVPTKIIKNRGYIFFSDECGGDEIASNYIESYVDMAESGREKRYRKFVLYAYSKLENSDGLKAEKRVRENQLKTQFVERGVMKKSDDDLDGLSDWINAEEGTIFEADSLIGSLNSSQYTLNDPSITNQQFIDICIGILEDGMY